MRKLSLKGKVWAVLFLDFLVASAILFDFEQMTLSIIALGFALVFAGLLLAEHKHLKQE